MSLSQIVPKLAFEIPLRYKIMGIVGSVWGISSIIGPILGGAILEFATWHWLFFINIPIAIIAIVLVLMTFHFPEEEHGNQTHFDVKGLSIFYIFIALLMIGLLNQQHLYLNIIAIILALLVLIGLFKIEQNKIIHFFRLMSLIDQ